MKYLLALLLLSLTFSLFSQDVIYESKELDLLVWEKINNRLESMGKKPISKFDDGKARYFSKRVSERMLPKGSPTVHSSQDSITKYSGGECIYSYTVQSSDIINNKFLSHLLTGDLDPIAQDIVDGWVSSKSHNRAISSDLWLTTTVSVMIHYNVEDGYYKLVANWQETDWLSNTVN